jgi:hypothetical protein
MDGSAYGFAGPAQPPSFSGAGEPLQDTRMAGLAFGRLSRNASANKERVKANS